MKGAEVIKLLPIEDRAKMEEKEVPSVVILSILAIGICLGFYYWFGDEFIFEYRTIAPFGGFVIFVFGGFIVDIIIVRIFSHYWREYNNLIKEANDEISSLIEKNDGSPEELYRMKRELIERKIGKETLSQEDFLWHTGNYCWGCGMKHTQPPKSYTVHKERKETWRDGVFRYSKTFSKTSNINICPECYSRLMNAKKTDNKNTPLIIITSIILGIGICTGSYHLWGENGLIISIISIIFGGIYILGLIASLLLYPFQKHGDSSTKWSFDEIPEIRKFLNQDLPHTH